MIIISISRQGNLKDIYKQKDYLVNDLTKDLDWTGAHKWQADGALEALEDFISFGDKKNTLHFISDPITFKC